MYQERLSCPSKARFVWNVKIGVRLRFGTARTSHELIDGIFALPKYENEQIDNAEFQKKQKI